MTSTDAEDAVRRWLDSLHEADLTPPAPKMVVLPEHTDERPWGWIIYYQSEQYLKTGNPTDMVAGNAPYFVNRKTGEMIVTGTASPIETYVKEYEEQLARDA